jgi:hypothetical protein
MKKVLPALGLAAILLSQSAYADPGTLATISEVSKTYGMCDAIPNFFNEAAYLKTYPDVAANIAKYNGTNPVYMRCGWQHFWVYGHADNRVGSPAK